MECPTCFEIYNDEIKKPHNLECGHTFCEDCLSRMVTNSRIQCPACRKTFLNIIPKSLPVNFIAADLARKHNDDKKKQIMCEKHPIDPVKFFCNTCEECICIECIIQHSGHQFVKQDESVKVLKSRVENITCRLDMCLEKSNGAIKELLREENSLIQRNEADRFKIEGELNILIDMLSNRKVQLLNTYESMISIEMNRIKDEQRKLEQQQSELVTVKEILLSKSLELLRINDTDLIGGKYAEDLNLVREKVNNLESCTTGTINLHTMSPTVDINLSTHLEYIQGIGNIIWDPRRNYEVIEPVVCYFGDKNKVMTYDITTKNWDLKTYYGPHEFNYYAAAVALPDGSALITGGGSSNAVYHYKNKQILLKESMSQIRKEHSAVCINNYVYALGGYDGINNNFLKQCERYCIQTNTWEECAPMNIPRCAFSATVVNNRFIFIFGGYDGTQRLGSIEKYNPDHNIWVVLRAALQFPLSNCACFSPERNKVIVLGGGFSSGFSLAVDLLDIETEMWIQLPQMTEGRDLRNKVTFLNGNAYCVGGYGFKAEMFNLARQSWEQLTNYLVSDNLDSWSSALTYRLVEKRESESVSRASSISTNY